MSRSITSGVATEIAADVKRPILIAEILTAGAPVRLWSGVGDLAFGGNTYVGVGTFGGMSTPEESLETKATGIIFTLSGIPPALLATAIGDVRQGLKARCWLGFVDAAGAVIADPTLTFEGYTAVPTTDDDAETCSISLSCESYMATLNRARSTRYTAEDQKTRDPSDKGFDFIPSLQDRVIPWGKS